MGDTETSPREKSSSVRVDFEAFDDHSLRIPLSDNNLHVHPADSSSPFINVPDSSMKRLSNVSTEGESKISSTPEGESYFLAREESFIKKVHEGELQTMAVEVSDYFSMESIDDDLTVKPLVEHPEAEIEITDLRPGSDMEESLVEEGRRWTAPAGTVEAPILEAEEFVVRLQLIAERTSGHWNELEKMLEVQSGREKEADSSNKIQQQ